MKFSTTVALLAQLLPAAAALKKFNFELTFGDIAQDGVTREMILINGASPGPTIEVAEGDQVEVIVKNSAPENTTIHFHGKDPLLSSNGLEYQDSALTVLFDRH